MEEEELERDTETAQRAQQGGAFPLAGLPLLDMAQKNIALLAAVKGSGKTVDLTSNAAEEIARAAAAARKQYERQYIYQKRGADILSRTRENIRSSLLVNILPLVLLSRSCRCTSYFFGRI